MADSIFASLGAGLKFKKPASNILPKAQAKSTHVRKFSSSDDAAVPSLDYFDNEEDKASQEESMDESEELMMEEFSDSEDFSDEEFSPNNFVKTRTIKVDGIDLPYLKLNKQESGNDDDEPLIEINPNSNKVISRISAFHQLGISDWLLKNIESKLQWQIPTHVQQMSIPALLEGRDILIASPTGSGKTAAFLIPILQLLINQKTKNNSKSKKENRNKKANPEKSNEEKKQSKCLNPRNVIVAPTAELVKQIFHQALLLATGQESNVSISLLTKTIIKKYSKSNKKESSESNNDDQNTNHTNDDQSDDTVDLLISTPSKIINMIENGTISLDNIDHLVLDEVDRLMTDEFLGQADTILDASKNSKQRRIAMFSATLVPLVENLAKSVLKDPIRARIGAKNTAADHVSQHLKYVGSEEGKLLAIRQMLLEGIQAPVLIFMQSKSRADQLVSGLSNMGLTIDHITGERSEAQRRNALLKFRSGEISVLITTDLLARGLDFKAVATVINYDMPTSPTTYIHRIGRTGRVGGVTGTSYTLFTDADLPHITPIANVMIRSGQKSRVPAWIQNLKQEKSAKKKHRPAVVNRDDIVAKQRTRYINPRRAENSANQDSKSNTKKRKQPSSNSKGEPAKKKHKRTAE